MKKLITANDIREAHARGEQAMSVVLRASIITPEAREVADLLGFTITECDESIPVTASVPASVPADKTESQRIRETIIAQLPEGQFTESLAAGGLYCVVAGGLHRTALVDHAHRAAPDYAGRASHTGAD